ncbi:MAG: NADH-quinone oxidoreductase subunit NuoE [Rhodobacteraceae bacterium]|nr:NADH-quinone oxidoreductase subunit NuoE [Paracoccaceae bacterium]
MLRRLHPDQPESFAFTPANLEWAKGQIAKFPEGRQASAIIPLLWRAQEQEGWLSRPAIEYVADMLGMAHIRALEVATFYFMFQLAPVGSVAHVQVCGTTTCMICGAEDLVAVCKERISPRPHQVSACGRFSWEEVECLGACANAPMVQIGKDYYEDLTAENFGAILDAFARGEVPVPGPQNGRFASEPLMGLTSLREFDSGQTRYNESAQRAVDYGDTITRITEPSIRKTPARAAARRAAKAGAKPDPAPAPAPATAGPARLEAPRGGKADDLKQIRGVGPKLERLLNEMGYYHLDQIAAWSAEERAFIDENVEGFRGRASRDDWVGQARKLTGA